MPQGGLRCAQGQPRRATVHRRKRARLRRAAERRAPAVSLRALHLGRREVGESSEGDSSGGAGDLTNDDKGGETEGSFTGGATDGRLVAGGGGLDGLSTLLKACCKPASFELPSEVSTFWRSSVTLLGCAGGGSTGHSISHCVAPRDWRDDSQNGGSSLVAITKFQIGFLMKTATILYKK